MKALTIKQPWADAITHGIKRIENRTRRAPAKHIGTRILIHAGAAYDLMGRFHINRTDLSSWPDTRKALLATATLAGCHEETHGCCAPWGEHNAWHWELEDVIALPEPVPATGQLGLWNPDPATLAAVTAQRG